MTAVTVLRAVRPAVRAAGATLLLAALTTGCGLAAEIEREANPARTPEPRATATAPGYGPATAPSLPPSPSTRTTDCTESGLRVGTTPVSAAMGLRATTLTLTNCGEDPYELNGYPSLTVLDEDREPVDIEILEGTDDISTGLRGSEPPAPLTLAPGESAETGLAWRNTVTLANAPAVRAPYLSVAPAPGEPAQVVEIDGGLDLGNTGRLGATVWHRTEK